MQAVCTTDVLQLSFGGIPRHFHLVLEIPKVIRWKSFHCALTTFYFGRLLPTFLNTVYTLTFVNADVRTTSSVLDV